MFSSWLKQFTQPCFWLRLLQASKYLSTDFIKLNITNSSSFHFLESLENISFKQHFANQSRCTLILWQIAFINVFHQPKLTKKKRLLEGKNFLKLSSCKRFLGRKWKQMSSNRGGLIPWKQFTSLYFFLQNNDNNS